MGMTLVAWAGGLVAALLTTVSGQQAPRPAFDTATAAWDRGGRRGQHAASFLTKLVTYDAQYFKSTDALVHTPGP
jgi:hypothetical protein